MTILILSLGFLDCVHRQTTSSVFTCKHVISKLVVVKATVRIHIRRALFARKAALLEDLVNGTELFVGSSLLVKA